MVKPGVRLGDIGHAIQHHAESNNYSVVREYWVPKGWYMVCAEAQP